MPTRRRIRGMTLIELLLGLSITAMVGMAIAGMLNAVSTGVGSRNDARSVMLHAHAAQLRLNVYLAPARCLLDLDNGDRLVVWLNDQRESESVHGSEIRWIDHDADSESIRVTFLDLPEAWSPAARQLADESHPLGSNWQHVRMDYASKGLLRTITLIDGVVDWSVRIPTHDPLEARHLTFDLDVSTETGVADVQCTAALRRHLTPEW